LIDKNYFVVFQLFLFLGHGCQSLVSLDGGAFQVALFCRDGRQLVFNETLSRFRGFSKMVKDQTLPHMITPAKQAYEAGATIGFGEFAISRVGIHRGVETLSWGRFESARTVKGRVIVRTTGCKMPFAEVAISRVSLL
jgi:hypothetical protein